MPILSYNGVSYTVDHATKGPDYIHGFDAEGNPVVFFDKCASFDGFSYTGEYLAPEACSSESCNLVKYVNGRLITSAGTEVSGINGGGQYELIKRVSFKDLDIVNGPQPSGKGSTWREMLVEFGKAYSHVLILVHSYASDTAERDMCVVLNGNHSGKATVYLPRYLYQGNAQYIRCHAHRDNGLWFVDKLPASASVSGTVSFSSTHTLFGFSNQRIDAEDGFADPTHLGPFEGINSCMVQVSVPYDKSAGAYVNPSGHITIYGVPNVEPLGLSYHSITYSNTDPNPALIMNLPKEAFAGSEVWIIDKQYSIREVASIVDANGNNIPFESYNIDLYNRYAIFTMPDSPVTVIFKGFN